MTVDATELREATQRHVASGMPPEQAIVLAVAELDGQPLNPFILDDAAVLLRAERLVIDGVAPSLALYAACGELMWSGRRRTGTGS